MPWNRSPEKATTEAAKQNAKQLRRALTPPERRLWWHLRHRLSQDVSHFRRQVPIGPYIADFCCLGARLLIEVDGGQHTFDQARDYDERRTTFLRQQGFRVLRFNNGDVMRNIDVVLDTVLAALVSSTPTPDPSPQGGGEFPHSLVKRASNSVSYGAEEMES